MRILPTVLLAASLAAPADAATSGAPLPGGIDTLRWRNRVLLLSAPTATDPQLVEQRRMLADWQQAARDRDVATVELVGPAVTGAGDTADSLRHRFALPADRFAALLIGKDGHVALRSAAPLGGADLTRTIDAMPMRRAGQR